MINIKREARTQVEIAQIIKVLDIKDEICQRHTRCDECPLGKLDVLETQTCDEIDKLAKRLDLAYRVVQTL